jgi:sugar/nucleoside kinase (ribokinase family)
MSRFDITFVGHICTDEIVPFEGPRQFSTGSAVLYGSTAAARTGRRIAAVIRMDPADGGILQPLREAGVACTIVPAEATTHMLLVHPTPDVDVREMKQEKSAGPFAVADMPDVDSRFLHLAGITDQEFTLPFMRSLKEKGHSLSVDMQSFVRQVDARSRAVTFADSACKREVVALMDRVKLDAVEARLLTGESDVEAAAKAVESWGCPEVVVTRAEGVLARACGRTFFERFTNRSAAGRTGRGDTTFAGYMAWRLEHDPGEALRFAAALASVKMESPGPFAGSLEDVQARMLESHS